MFRPSRRPEGHLTSLQPKVNEPRRTHLYLARVSGTTGRQAGVVPGPQPAGERLSHDVTNSEPTGVRAVARRRVPSRKYGEPQLLRGHSLPPWSIRAEL